VGVPACCLVEGSEPLVLPTGEAVILHETDLLHQQRSRHRLAIKKSRTCGCFHCQGFFRPSEIKEWADPPADGSGGLGQTAICLRCGVDAVLPEPNGVYPMGPAILRQMHWRWFGEGTGVGSR